ncbi:MAG: 30S ribosomal protein S9 [Patescibacteria group bacterium]|jgi:small subunit ribosomal protein S9
MAETKATTKIVAAEEKVKNDIFKGRYIAAIGRRKRAIAQTRLYEKGKGIIMVNGMKATDYFPAGLMMTVNQPLKLTGRNKDFDFSILTSGGGKSGQSEAVRLGISRALIKFDPELRPALKAKGYLTRDAREVERKKPGLKKARRAPQWSKR